MDKSDWIYVGFLIFSIVMSILGKKKKKNRLRHVKPVQTKPVSSELEDALKKMMGIEPVDPREEVEVIKEAKEKKPEGITSKKKPVISEDPDTNAGIKDLIKGGEIGRENSDENGYDLREMVIYEAILNRPEF